jgi:hypothetical protein
MKLSEFKSNFCSYNEEHEEFRFGRSQPPGALDRDREVDVS